MKSMKVAIAHKPRAPALKQSKGSSIPSPCFDEASVKDKLFPKSTSSKTSPTTQGKVQTKRQLVLEYNLNSPQMTAFEVAEKLKTTPNYVWKVLSEARKQGKVQCRGYGRIFGHGKVFYEWWVPQSWLASLEAQMVNERTGMRQIGFNRMGDSCSVQIHPNGHLVIWPHSSGWRQWLVEELSSLGWSWENAKVVVDHAQLNVSVVEGGVKPGEPRFLPKDFYIETDWGVVICRDDTPEKSVLELKLSIPKMQSYLGIPGLIKKLEVIEQGSMTVAQRQRAIEALLYMLIKLLQKDERS